MEENRTEFFPNWLYRHNLARPDGLALRAGDEELTFGELFAGAVRLAGRLKGMGIGKGSRVALLLGNGRPYAELFHALMQLEAVLIPLNVRLTPAELAWQLADVRAELLLSGVRFEETARQIVATLPGLPHLAVFSEGTALGEGPAEEFSLPERFEAAALHTIIYSSGTTGRPKGVRLTYGNHFFNASASNQNLPVGPDDCWLAVLPLFHVGGQAILWRGLFYAMPVMVQEAFDPATVNRAIDEQGVTLVSVVANMLARLLDQRQDRPYPARFRCMLVGGGPVPPPLLERCAGANVPVVQTYGMTETASQAVTLAPQDALRKLGSAGKPLPGVELRIETAGKGEEDGVGEILLRGPIVTPGYEGRAEETDRAWRGGWFHTGDLGRLDDEGYLYVVDRRDDLIISGGENIYPAEVEAALLSHPAVEEAGVAGQPDERWGQVVAAFVKLRPGSVLSEEEVIAFCAERLARYKLPRSVKFVQTLPRNATGKLLRRLLKNA